MGDDAIFPNDWVDTIVEEISHEEIVNELLRRDMTTNGLSMVETAMKLLTGHFREREFDMQYEKLMAEPKSISDIEAFAEVADLWRWKGIDQTCFSNDQTPGQVYRILAEGVTMFLFIEIDVEDPRTRPQTTAMKLWQDVTFGRVHEAREGTSVATIRINMGTARKDQFEAYASDDIHRNLMYPGQLYSWMINLARATVYTIGNYIAHNIGGGKRKKDHSAWSKVTNSDNVYDLHFVIGDYEGKFPSQCRTGRVPADKFIGRAEIATQQFLGMDNIQTNPSVVGVGGRPTENRNYFTKQRDEDARIQEQSYRPICLQTFKENRFPPAPPPALIAGVYTNDIDTANRCMLFNMYADVHVGKTEQYGATINHFFVQRVSWKDIEAVVLKCKEKITEYAGKIRARPANARQLEQERDELIRNLFLRKIRGVWYLQDMQHFLSFAVEAFGFAIFYNLTDILFDTMAVFGNAGVAADSEIVPETWHKIDENDTPEIPLTRPLVNAYALGYDRRELIYDVYDQILEPFVAEMENIYHRIIYREQDHALRFPTDENAHWIDMKSRLLTLKEQHETKQLKVRTRENNEIIQELPAKFKKMNLRDCLLGAIAKDSRVILEPALQRYLNKYKSEYMAVFCRLVQCHSLIALHELANKYQVEHYKEMVETALDAFGLTVQTEILFMLTEVAKDSSVLFETQKLKVSLIRPIQKPFWIRRVRGSYTFGRGNQPNENDYITIPGIVDCINNCPQLRKHLDEYGYEQIKYWKFLTQQDFYKGLPMDDAGAPVASPGEFALIDVYRQHPDPNMDITIVENMKQMYDIPLSVDAEDQNAVNLTTEYFQQIRRLFRFTLRRTDGPNMPLLFYTRVFFACRHIALAGLIPRAGELRYPSEMWLASHSRNRDGRVAGEEYACEYMRIQYTDDNRGPTEVEVTEDVARMLMYTECLCLLVNLGRIYTNTPDNEKDQKWGELVYSIKKEIEELEPRGANSSYDLNFAQIGGGFTLDAYDRITTAMQLPDIERTILTQKILSYTRQTQVPLLNVSTGGVFIGDNHKTIRIGCGARAGCKANVKFIGDNFAKFVLLMKLHCNRIMAEIENQIKLPVVMKMTRGFSLQNDVNIARQDTSIEDIFRDNINTSRMLKSLIQFPGPSAETLEGSENLFSNRELWFKDRYEHHVMHSFCSLRDAGLFRHEPFRARLFRYKASGNVSDITTCVASEETGEKTQKLMVQTRNSIDGINSIYQRNMTLEAYILTINTGSLSRSNSIPLFFDTSNATEKEIIDRIRENVQGQAIDPLNYIPTPLRARVTWTAATQPDSSLLQGADDPSNGNPRTISCLKWSVMNTVYEQANPAWTFTQTPLNVMPPQVNFTVDLYHGNPRETYREVGNVPSESYDSNMERDTSRLWKELYEKCLLPHNSLVPQNVRDVYDDFVKIERRRMKMYKNLETKTLPGNLGAYWLARDDSAPVCFKHGRGAFFIECDKCSRNRKLELERAEGRPDDRSSILSQRQWEAQFTRAYRWKYLAISCVHSILSKNILWKSLSEYRAGNAQLNDDLNHFDDPGV
tara:strand:+ start:1598 stop:6253 length:4656 start_codon:yes stop_codon:yes gene_type:complete